MPKQDEGQNPFVSQFEDVIKAAQDEKQQLMAELESLTVSIDKVKQQIEGLDNSITEAIQQVAKSAGVNLKQRRKSSGPRKSKDQVNQEMQQILDILGSEGQLSKAELTHKTGIENIGSALAKLKSTGKVQSNGKGPASTLELVVAE